MFEVRDLVLKRNSHQDSCHEKFKAKYLGPYRIRGKTDNGNILLCDRYLHDLKKSIHPSQLVKFYENKMYKVDKKCSIPAGHMSSNDFGDDDLSCDDFSTDVNTCEQTKVYDSSQKSVPLTSTPIKSQLVIISNTEMPLSSDESSTIDVGIEIQPKNPFGDIDVDMIPIEIVDNLNDTTITAIEEIITSVDDAPLCLYNPLTDEDHIIAALKFSLVINSHSHPVWHSGAGLILSKPPQITIQAQGNGACLFNSFSLLLSGRDTYSAIIRHVICNYIANPVKYSALEAYIPSVFKSGKQYVQERNMRNFTTWGTEVEIIAFAQISGFDVKVYTQHGTVGCILPWFMW